MVTNLDCANLVISSTGTDTAELEIAKIMLTATLTFSAILLALLGFLISSYKTVEYLPTPSQKALKIYRYTIWSVVILLTINTVAIIGNLGYLLSGLQIFTLLLGLLVSITILILAMAVLIAAFMVR